MKIVVLAKMIPDLVEELRIEPNGKKLDPDWLRLIVNELDLHASEQAVLLKEQHGGSVTVIAPEDDGVEDFLYTAAAMGADRLVRLAGLPTMPASALLAAACTPLLRDLAPELILTGVQASNDLDGQLGPFVAAHLGWPYTGYVSACTWQVGALRVSKEFPGGLIGHFEVRLPAVIGIQAAASPPRYVAFSRIRQARSQFKIEDVAVPQISAPQGPHLERLYLPEFSTHAEMLAGQPHAVAAQLLEILRERAII
jgi:electron transfer flavoprotein beta subunit